MRNGRVKAGFGGVFRLAHSLVLESGEEVSQDWLGWFFSFLRWLRDQEAGFAWFAEFTVAACWGAGFLSSMAKWGCGFDDEFASLIIVLKGA